MKTTYLHPYRLTDATNVLAVLLLAFCVFRCGQKIAEPLSDQIRKVWMVQTVTENGVVVYIKGASGNVRNYASYRLDLSGPPTVRLAEVDGNIFVGQYEIQNDNRLILTDLNPQPMGTGGRLEYGLGAVTANSMELSQLSGNIKTGNTMNVYRLSN